MDRFELAIAEDLLGCPRGASRAQVQSAYRRTLLRGRPDLGLVDGAWTARVQAARDLLLAAAPPDRRRRSRRAAPPVGDSWVPLRRATWDPADRLPSDLDLRL